MKFQTSVNIKCSNCHRDKRSNFVIIFTYLQGIYQVHRSMYGSSHNWYPYTKLTYFQHSPTVALDEIRDLQLIFISDFQTCEREQLAHLIFFFYNFCFFLYFTIESIQNTWICANNWFFEFPFWYTWIERLEEYPHTQRD